MRRLVVITDLAEAAGGATSLAIASAVSAAKRSIPVTYISADGPIGEDLRRTGIELSLIPGDIINPAKRAQGFVQGLYRRSAGHHLRRWIAENDTPDTVYHLHNWSRFLSPAIFAPLARIADRLVCTTHDFFLTCPNGAQYSFTDEAACTRRPNGTACLSHNCDRRHYAQKLWRSARHALRQTIFSLDRRGVSYVAIHDSMIPLLTLGGMPENHIRVIRNPIRPFTQERVTVENNREVLFVGRLTSEKGPDLAAQAARAAGLRMSFVGEGPMKEQLRAMAPDAAFHGWRTRAEIGEISQSARMLVMPSRWAEPYGMVAGEALWSGLPVIASDNAYLAPEIAAAGAGLSVHTRDIDAFADAMRHIAGNDEAARAMSLAAIGGTGALGNTLTDWEEEYLALYQSRLSLAA